MQFTSICCSNYVREGISLSEEKDEGKTNWWVSFQLFKWECKDTLQQFIWHFYGNCFSIKTKLLVIYWRKKRSILIFGYHNNLHLLNPKWDDFPQQRHSFIRRYPPRRSSDIKWILQTCNWPTMEVADCPNASCHQQTNPDRAILRESAPPRTTLRCGWVD